MAEARKIICTGKTKRKIDPEEVAKALGAKPMTKEEVVKFLRKAHGCDQKGNTNDKSK